MTRDEFLAGGGDTYSRPGRRLFLVAIDSDAESVERSLRAAVVDYFGSLAGGVRRLDQRLSTDQVMPLGGEASVDRG